MNNPKRIYQVGYCYYLGIGVEIDKHKAFTYYLKSAETGNSMGIWKTAICYYYGIGVEENDDKFYEWIKKRMPISINAEIDDCIREFQLRIMRYGDVIDWIPFDRLSDVKEIGKRGFGSVYKATWLYGKREEKKLKMYADKESLNKYLKKNFNELTWQTRLQILEDISDELDNIHHYGEYIHADFHSGNILQGQHTNENARSYIADLGLSRKKDKCISESDIYSVMPYVAPEVLLGNQQFTQAADIYGFGIIMAELSTGQRPFDGHKFDSKLAVKICRGLRPELASRTPNCYVELAKQCMHSDPQEHPSAVNILSKIRGWLADINSSNDNEIKKQFLDADKIVK
ncbi:kinase-like domain-containing protein [Gigaspora rosea]|uniref:Kinase-like domain-containing protein n=1 Tax=Gigaspora rosea TaxID=44941 RepID=A0A397ULT6_9GLOM|nr:kinase-like domain-containing protein [Gigaspora rosea]